MWTAENNAPTNQRRDQQKRAVVGGDDGDAMATVMDGNGRYYSNAAATTAMERGGDGGGAPTSDGHHRGMLEHYVRESAHLELSSFRYKYCAPPHRSREGFTYARPLPPQDVRDLNRAPGHVSKFNGLSYDNDIYGDDEWPLSNKKCFAKSKILLRTR